VSSASNPSPEFVRARPEAPLALRVELDPTADNAMLRVLTLLARRRCNVLRAAFVPDPDAGCDLLSVELDAPRHLDRNLVAWVSALVPVLGVRCL
jgi:hypothetical protein